MLALTCAKTSGECTFSANLCRFPLLHLRSPHLVSSLLGSPEGSAYAGVMVRKMHGLLAVSCSPSFEYHPNPAPSALILPVRTLIRQSLAYSRNISPYAMVLT